MRIYGFTALSDVHSCGKSGADQKRLQAQQAKQAPPQKQGWISWALGYSATTASENEEPGSDGMTDKQRQGLHAAIDYEESDEVAGGLVLPRDIMKAQISAQLRTGSLSLLAAQPPRTMYIRRR